MPTEQDELQQLIDTYDPNEKDDLQNLIDTYDPSQDHALPQSELGSQIVPTESTKQALQTPEEQPITVGKAAARGFLHGTSGLGESVGLGAQYIGEKAKSLSKTDIGESLLFGSPTFQAKFREYANILSQAGQTAAEGWERTAQKFEQPPELQGAIVNKPSLLAKPEWWAYGVMDMVPSFAASMVGGVGGARAVSILGQKVVANPQMVARLARLGGSLSGGAIGGGLEGTWTYKELLDKGASQEEAQSAAEMMGLAAAGLNALSLNKLFNIPDKGKRMIAKYIQSGVWEGVTEYAEEPSEAVIKYLHGYATPEEMAQQTIEGLNVLPIAAVTGGLGSVTFETSAQRNEEIGKTFERYKESTGNERKTVFQRLKTLLATKSKEEIDAEKIVEEGKKLEEGTKGKTLEEPVQERPKEETKTETTKKETAKPVTEPEQPKKAEELIEDSGKNAYELTDEDITDLVTSEEEEKALSRERYDAVKKRLIAGEEVPQEVLKDLEQTTLSTEVESERIINRFKEIEEQYKGTEVINQYVEMAETVEELENRVQERVEKLGLEKTEDQKEAEAYIDKQPISDELKAKFKEQNPVDVEAAKSIFQSYLSEKNRQAITGKKESEVDEKGKLGINIYTQRFNDFADRIIYERDVSIDEVANWLEKNQYDKLTKAELNTILKNIGFSEKKTKKEALSVLQERLWSRQEDIIKRKFGDEEIDKKRAEEMKQMMQRKKEKKEETKVRRKNLEGYQEEVNQNKSIIQIEQAIEHYRSVYEGATTPKRKIADVDMAQDAIDRIEILQNRLKELKKEEETKRIETDPKKYTHEQLKEKLFKEISNRDSLVVGTPQITMQELRKAIPEPSKEQWNEALLELQKEDKIELMQNTDPKFFKEEDLETNVIDKKGRYWLGAVLMKEEEKPTKTETKKEALKAPTTLLTPEQMEEKSIEVTDNETGEIYKVLPDDLSLTSTGNYYSTAGRAASVIKQKGLKNTRVVKVAEDTYALYPLSEEQAKKTFKEKEPVKKEAKPEKPTKKTEKKDAEALMQSVIDSYNDKSLEKTLSPVYSTMGSHGIYDRVLWVATKIQEDLKGELSENVDLTSDIYEMFDVADSDVALAELMPEFVSTIKELYPEFKNYKRKQERKMEEMRKRRSQQQGKSKTTEKAEETLSHLKEAGKASMNALKDLFGEQKGFARYAKEEDIPEITPLELNEMSILTWGKVHNNLKVVWKELQAAGQSFLDFVNAVLEQMGDQALPYLQRFKINKEYRDSYEDEVDNYKKLVEEFNEKFPIYYEAYVGNIRKQIKEIEAREYDEIISDAKDRLEESGWLDENPEPVDIEEEEEAVLAAYEKWENDREQELDRLHDVIVDELDAELIEANTEAEEEAINEKLDNDDYLYAEAEKRMGEWDKKNPKPETEEQFYERLAANEEEYADWEDARDSQLSDLQDDIEREIDDRMATLEDELSERTRALEEELSYYDDIWENKGEDYENMPMLFEDKKNAPELYDLFDRMNDATNELNNKYLEWKRDFEKRFNIAHLEEELDVDTYDEIYNLFNEEIVDDEYTDLFDEISTPLHEGFYNQDLEDYVGINKNYKEKDQFFQDAETKRDEYSALLNNRHELTEEQLKERSVKERMNDIVQWELENSPKKLVHKGRWGNVWYVYAPVTFENYFYNDAYGKSYQSGFEALLESEEKEIPGYKEMPREEFQQKRRERLNQRVEYYSALAEAIENKDKEKSLKLLNQRADDPYFQMLIKRVKTKAWNSAKYMMGDMRDAYYATTLQKVKGQSVQSVENNVKGIGLPIKVVGSINNLPNYLKQRAINKERLTKGKVQGIYDTVTDQVYLIADVIPNRKVAIERAIHEWMHKGFHHAFGDNYKFFLYQLSQDKKYRDKIIDLKKKLNLTDDYVAVEEWFVTQAVKRRQNPTVWQRFKDFMNGMFKYWNINLKISDTFLESLIAQSWKSTQHFKKTPRSNISYAMEPIRNTGKVMFSVEDSKSYSEQATKKYGSQKEPPSTDSYFMLPDGNFLKNDNQMFHEMQAEEIVNDEEEFYPIEKLQRNGFIRMGEETGIEVGSKPTAKQYRTLENYLKKELIDDPSRSGGMIFFEALPPNSRQNRLSLMLTADNYQALSKQIDDFYDGKRRYQSEIQEFRYRDDDTDVLFATQLPSPQNMGNKLVDMLIKAGQSLDKARDFYSYRKAAIKEWYKKRGVNAFLIDRGMVRNWNTFVDNIKEGIQKSGDNPVKKFMSLLPKQIQDRIKNVGQKGLSIPEMNSISDAINNVIKENTLYDDKSFADTVLNERIMDLLEMDQSKISDEDVAKKNRLLLEAAFPKDFTKLPKTDISLFQIAVSLPEYYTWLDHAARRIYEAAMKRDDIKFETQNMLFRKDPLQPETYIQDIEKFAYLSKTEKFLGQLNPEYERFGEYLRDQDINQTGYKVKRDKKKFNLMDPKGKLVKSYTRESDAWKAAITAEANDFITNGWSQEAVDALIAFRTISHRMYGMLKRDYEEIIDNAVKSGRPIPKVVMTDDKGKKVKVSLRTAIAEIGDLRGFYFPRLRRGGRYTLYATKENENPEFEFYDYKMALSPGASRIQELKKKGYTIEGGGLKPSGTLSEDIYGDLPSIMSIDKVLNESFDKMEKLSATIKSLGDIGFTSRWYTKANKKKVFAIKGPRNPRYNEIFKKLFKGRYYNNEWNFENPSPQIEKQIIDALNQMGIIGLEWEEKLAESFMKQIEAVYESRGALSRKISRRQAVGKEVPLGYEKDPLYVITMAARGVAGGYAKRITALNMIKALEGRDISWDQFKTSIKPDATYSDYMAFVRERMIQPGEGKQKYLYGEMKSYIMDQLRNEETADRAVGFMKSLAVFKFLWGRPSSVLVNLTALPTTIATTIQAYAQTNPAQVMRDLTVAMNGWRKWHYNRGKVDPILARVYDDIEKRGWHEAQFNREVIEILMGRFGRSYQKVMELGMYPFGMAERLNRSSAVSATYINLYRQYLKDNNLKWGAPITDIQHEEWMKLGRDVSNRSNAVYGKVNNPWFARGQGIGGMIGRSATLFMRFGHSLILNIVDLLTHKTHGLGMPKREAVAASYLVLSSSAIGGVGVGAGMTLVWPMLRSAFIKLFDWDPEEELYAWIHDSLGLGAERFLRYGIAGAAGANLKGSLDIGMTSLPDSGWELFGLGAFKAMVVDTRDALKYLWQGKETLALEKISPLAISNMFKAYREYNEGIKNLETGEPLYFGRDPVKLSFYEAMLRFASFNPARVAGIREIQWNEKYVGMELTKIRSDIYKRAREYFSQSSDNREPTKFLEIIEDWKTYNKFVVDQKKQMVYPLIAPNEFWEQALGHRVPPKRERYRQNYKGLN